MQNDNAPGLAAHKGLRGQILLELKRKQPLTAQELATQYGVSANAVRRHLKELQAEGLVLYGRERRGQGAPTFAYRLTNLGEEVFPKRYAEALTGFLSFVEKQRGREEVSRFFAEHFRAHADEMRERLAGADLPTRAQAVVDLLSSQGFMAEWSLQAGTFTIAEHNCAVSAVVEQFPEICRAEADFLREVLGADVVRRSHIPAGCNACEYSVAHGAQPAPVHLGGRPVESQ
jgi:DeoR family suf operon transcriptional repressor